MSSPFSLSPLISCYLSIRRSVLLLLHQLTRCSSDEEPNVKKILGNTTSFIACAIHVGEIKKVSQSCCRVVCSLLSLYCQLFNKGKGLKRFLKFYSIREERGWSKCWYTGVSRLQWLWCTHSKNGFGTASDLHICSSALIRQQFTWDLYSHLFSVLLSLLWKTL